MEIYTAIPDRTDITSFHRSWGPKVDLEKFSKLKGKITFNFYDQASWPVIWENDMAFLQRPFNSQHQNTMVWCKEMFKPVWIDYDDDLFNVPDDNPTVHLYQNPQTKASIISMLGMADYVTVSTKTLVDLYKPHAGPNTKVLHIPNAFNDKFAPKRVVDGKRQQKVVLWRGTNTHNKSLLEVAPQIVEAAAKHPDWTFIFLGHNPYFLTDSAFLKALYGKELNNMIWHGGVHIHKYYALLQNIRPAILISPHTDCAFSRAKSCTAYYQASYSGAVTIAPNWEEWSNPGTINYDGTAEDFGQKLIETMSLSQDDRYQHVNTAWNWIKQNRFIGVVNEQRVNMLQEIKKKLKEEHPNRYI